MCKSITMIISTSLLHWVLKVITRTNLWIISVLIYSIGTYKRLWVISIILLHHLNDLITSSPSLQDRLSNNSTAAIVRSIRSSSIIESTLNRGIVIRSAAAILSNTKSRSNLLNLIDLPVQIVWVSEALLTALPNKAWPMSLNFRVVIKSSFACTLISFGRWKSLLDKNSSFRIFSILRRTSVP